MHACLMLAQGQEDGGDNRAAPGDENAPEDPDHVYCPGLLQPTESEEKKEEEDPDEAAALLPPAQPEAREEEGQKKEQELDCWDECSTSCDDVRRSNMKPNVICGTCDSSHMCHAGEQGFEVPAPADRDQENAETNGDRPEGAGRP